MRHDTKYLEYDENDNFVHGNRDILSLIVEPLTKIIDLSNIGNNIVNFFKIISGVLPGMYLKVDINQLLSDADDMSFEIEEILKEVRSVYDDVQALGAMWQGTASDKFATSLVKSTQRLMSILPS